MDQMAHNDQHPAIDASWIPLSLRDGGVPYELLFQIYNDIFRSRVIVKDS